MSSVETFISPPPYVSNAMVTNGLIHDPPTSQLIGLRALQVMYNYRSRRRAFEREVKILTDDD